LLFGKENFIATLQFILYLCSVCVMQMVHAGHTQQVGAIAANQPVLSFVFISLFVIGRQFYASQVGNIANLRNVSGNPPYTVRIDFLS